MLKILLAFGIAIPFCLMGIFGLDLAFQWSINNVHLPHWLIEMSWMTALFLACWTLLSKAIPYLVKCIHTPTRLWGWQQGALAGAAFSLVYYIVVWIDCPKICAVTAVFVAGLICALSGMIHSSGSPGFNKPRSMLDEKPIEHEADDILGAELAVNEIVTTLGPTWKVGDSTVAVFGPNGIGKSSCINLAIRRLKRDYPDMLIQPFDPYRYPEEVEMVRNFFEAIMAPLDQRYALPGISRFSRKLTSIAYGTSAESFISIQLGNVIDLFVPQGDLTELHDRIEAYLEALGKRVLIVVDDIDRCSIRKRHLFFQMVNSMKNMARVRILISASANELLGNKEPLSVTIVD